jgi:hypothetical protein
LSEISRRRRGHDAVVHIVDKLVDARGGHDLGRVKKNPVQLASRRSKGKDLPNKVRRRTDNT